MIINESIILAKLKLLHTLWKMHPDVCDVSIATGHGILSLDTLERWIVSIQLRDYSVLKVHRLMRLANSAYSYLKKLEKNNGN